MNEYIERASLLDGISSSEAGYSEVIEELIYKHKLDFLHGNNEDSVRDFAYDLIECVKNYIRTEPIVDPVKEFAEKLKPYEEKACCWCKHSDNGKRSSKCDEIIDDTGNCVKLWCVGWQKFESNIDNILKERIGE